LSGDVEELSGKGAFRRSLVCFEGLVTVGEFSQLGEAHARWTCEMLNDSAVGSSSEKVGTESSVFVGEKGAA